MQIYQISTPNTSYIPLSHSSAAFSQYLLLHFAFLASFTLPPPFPNKYCNALRSWASLTLPPPFPNKQQTQTLNHRVCNGRRKTLCVSISNPQPSSMQWEEKNIVCLFQWKHRNRNLMTKPCTLIRVQICDDNGGSIYPNIKHRVHSNYMVWLCM